MRSSALHRGSGRCAYLAAVLALSCAAPAGATVVSAFVAPSYGAASGIPSGGFEYDAATVQMTLDPANTRWIAMQDYFSEPATPGTYACAASPAGCVGSHGFGTDDFIDLTITNPGGVAATVRMDWNDAFGNSSGAQMVIFGSAADAPDVRRYHFPSGPYYYIDEGGAFGTGIFSAPGVYTFDFSFRNQWSSAAGHNWMYLLADVVGTTPEPASALLFGLSLIGLLGCRIGRHRGRRAG